MDKWLNLSKKGHDVDNNATKSSQAGLNIHKQASNMRKRKYDESFLQLGLHLEIAMVMKTSLFDLQ